MQKARELILSPDDEADIIATMKDEDHADAKDVLAIIEAMPDSRGDIYKGF